jgi:FMN phosphatase YigB (HAD superfamily)
VSRHGPRHLVIFDAGGTLLMTRAINRRKRISAVSPLPDDEVRRYVHERVLTLTRRQFTPGRIGAFAAELGIPASEFPYRPELPGEEYVVDPTAPAVVAAVARYARISVCSNVSAFDADAMEETLRAWLPDVEKVWLSCRMGRAKPDPLVFHACARAADVPVERCVMIGDAFDNDIAGALDVGMRAGWLNRDGQPVPAAYADCVRRGSLVEADSLAEVVSEAARRWLPVAGAG